jgi:hypothetical protein
VRKLGPPLELIGPLFTFDARPSRPIEGQPRLKVVFCPGLRAGPPYG